jgi:peptidoglycan hydrolase-like protein with peptidoglycan-binding domain
MMDRRRLSPLIAAFILMGALVPASAAGRAGSCPERKATPANAMERPRLLFLQNNLVRAVARKLRQKGYKGPIDGIYHDELSAAVSRVQRKANLPVTGDLDCDTVEVILQVDLRQRLQ